MYISDQIKSGLFGLIGWRQNYDVSDFTISSSLTDSLTGQFFQDFHPLITLDNIKAIAPEFEAITYPDWNITTQYYTGDRVTVSDVNYRALRNTLGDSPSTSPNDWEVFDAFSEWLENKTKASILNMMRKFWDVKMSDKTAKDILESKPLFDGTGRISDTINNQSNLVGFEITPIRSKGVTVKIDRIGLQFTGTGDIPVYLFHSSRSEALQELTLTRTRNGGMEWFVPSTDLFLPYISDDKDAGGSWYLCYNQDDLPEGVQAIRTNKDWSQSPCTCSRGEYSNWQIWSRYIEIHPFKVSGFDSNIWDIENNLYTLETNYGINLQITVSCDITEIVLEQKQVFQNVLGLQVAIDMLREFAYNPAFNIGRQQQNLSTNQILYELDGDSTSEKKSGLKYELTKAMEALSIDFTELSRVCFRCNKRGIKYRAV